MSDIMHEIEIRRARRALDTEPVREDILRRIMEAAVLAPSCFNNQPWRFLVVTGEEHLSKIHANLPGANYWVKKAPVVVAVAVRKEDDCTLSDGRDYAFFDAALAVMNLVLQATHEGLIAHPIAGYKPVEIKEALGIPQDYTLITLVALGHPGDESHLNEKHLELEHSKRDRKPLEEVVFRNTWAAKE
ncbi:MAG: nitroreductase family protein [Spirochaetales bacterium]|nr:nitroreductase family protein [Spirochaetales bacterium]